MSEPTTTPTPLATEELYEDDPMEAAESEPGTPDADSPPADVPPAETPPPVDASPPPDAPPVEAPPVETAPATPKPEGKHPSFSELRTLRKQLEERDATISQLRTVGPVAAQQPQQQPQQPQAAQAPPDPTEDPIGYMQWQQGQVVQQQQWLAQQSQYVQQRQAAIELQNLLNSQISDYSAKQPDYRDAAAYLEQREIGRWKALGYTDQEAIQQTQQRALQVIDAALKLGRSIPEALYEIALVDGWTGPQIAQAAGAIGAISPGASPAAKVVASKAKSAASRTSMGSVAGTPSPGKRLSRQQILAMSEEELERTFGEGTAWMDMELED